MNISVIEFIGIEIVATLFGGIWFLMTRASFFGANNKKLNLLADAVADFKTTMLTIRTELKEDISTLDVKIDTVRTKLKKNINDVRTELKENISNARTDLKEKIDDVKEELKENIISLKGDFRRELAVDNRINLLTQRLYKRRIAFGEIRNC
ncbi:MAG: hypothetical protein LBS55_14490 [Prevotellaceae bacterium]|nr:hypothetical protein [Prevotellaceae bacterium]